jgi:hypothetical protein
MRKFVEYYLAVALDIGANRCYLEVVGIQTNRTIWRSETLNRVFHSAISA